MIACFIVPRSETDDSSEAAHIISLENELLLDLAAAPNGNVFALLASRERELVSVVEYTFEGHPARRYAVECEGKHVAVGLGAMACGEGYVAVALVEEGMVSVSLIPLDGTKSPEPWKHRMTDVHDIVIRNGMLVLFGFNTITLHDLLSGDCLRSLPVTALVSGGVFGGGHLVYASGLQLHLIEWTIPLHLGCVKLPIEETGSSSDIMDVTCSREHVFVRTITDEVFVYKVNA
jgi:hypothetical protein